jgi:hypothetical protein
MLVTRSCGGFGPAPKLDLSGGQQVNRRVAAVLTFLRDAGLRPAGEKNPHGLHGNSTFSAPGVRSIWPTRHGAGDHDSRVTAGATAR